MGIRLYIDESVSDSKLGERYFVMAGHAATDEMWCRFCDEWQSLLPWAPMGRNGVRRFKLSEMGVGDEANFRIRTFYRVIEAHVSLSVSVIFRLDDLVRAKRRIFAPGFNIEWGMVGDPYTVGLKAILQVFNHNRHLLSEVMDPNVPVHFTFDDFSQAKQIKNSWPNLVNTSTLEFRMSMPDEPSFEDEETCLPLQAADLYAGLVRRANEGWPQPLAGETVRRDVGLLDAVLTEDDMVKNFVLGIKHDLPGQMVIDLKTFQT